MEALRRGGIACAAGLLLSSILAGAAGAAGAADPLARVRAALAKAKSYAFDFSASTYAANGSLQAQTHGETIVVLPESYHTFEALDKNGRYEEIVVGASTYVRLDGAAWATRRTTRGALGPLRTAFLKFNEGMVAGPDRVEAGSSVGTFTWSSPPSRDAATSSETCSYDKTTYLLRTCTTTSGGGRLRVVKAYARWNDPSNAVVPPSNLAP